MTASSPASLIGAILHTTPPPLSTLARDVPPALERLLANCLAKAPDDRWSSAHDVCLQLKTLDETATAATAINARNSRRRERLAWGVAAAAALAAIVLAALAATGRLGPPPRAAGLEVLSLLPPLDARFDYGEAPQVSPDGRHIAFVAMDRDGRTWLYLRSRDRDDARPLADTDDATMPFWSPDSRRIGFFAHGPAEDGVGGGRHATVPRAGASATRRHVESRRHHPLCAAAHVADHADRRHGRHADAATWNGRRTIRRRSRPSFRTDGTISVTQTGHGHPDTHALAGRHRLPTM